MPNDPAGGSRDKEKEEDRRIRIQEDDVSGLKRSRKKHGEIPGHPIIKDQFGILDGVNREEAGFKESITIPVVDEVDHWEKRMALAHQKRATETEEAKIIENLCLALEKRGLTNDQIVKHILKNDVWGESWTYNLIKDRYKRPNFGRPKGTGETFQSPESLGPRPMTVMERMSDEGHQVEEERLAIAVCPGCAMKTVYRITAGGLLEKV